MVIRMGEARWIVEAERRRERPGGGVGQSVTPEAPGVVDLTFRREEPGQEERVELGWVPLLEPLTPELACRLFELAGRRRWRDGRNGRRYSVELVVTGPDEERGELSARFQPEDGAGVTVPYVLSRPLGLATAPELEAMVDAARAGRTARVHPA